MSTIEEAVHEEWIRGLVQMAIFCPITGNVLDYRTCAVLRDGDRDPIGVYAPEVVDVLTDRLKAVLAEKGFTIEPNPRVTL